MRCVIIVMLLAAGVAYLLNTPLTAEDRHRIMVKQENEKTYITLKQSLNTPHESSPLF